MYKACKTTSSQITGCITHLSAPDTHTDQEFQWKCQPAQVFQSHACSCQVLCIAKLWQVGWTCTNWVQKQTSKQYTAQSGTFKLFLSHPKLVTNLTLWLITIPEDMPTLLISVSSPFFILPKSALIPKKYYFSKCLNIFCTSSEIYHKLYIITKTCGNM